jgi:hypothetical protein
LKTNQIYTKNYLENLQVMRDDCVQDLRVVAFEQVRYEDVHQVANVVEQFFGFSPFELIVCVNDTALQQAFHCRQISETSIRLFNSRLGLK